MANYPKELTDLVNEYLTDGIITTKERQVLISKAVSLGIDADEFDLYIDAQQQKVDQQIDAAASKKRGSVCPFCNAPVPLLAEKCPECGQIITAQASEELEEILNALEDALVDFKAGKDIDKNKAIVERYVRKSKLYYGQNPKIQRLLSEIEIESEKTASAAQKRKKIDRLKRYWFLWLLLSLLLGFILLVIIALVGAYIDEHSFTRPEIIREQINTAITSGDLDMAQKIVSEYKMENHAPIDSIYPDIVRLSKTCIEKGDYDRVIKLSDYIIWSKQELYYSEFADSFLEAKEYIRLIHFHRKLGDWREYEIVVNKCIECMKKDNMPKRDIKLFIDMAFKHYSEDKQEKIITDFYKAAGIKN